MLSFGRSLQSIKCISSKNEESLVRSTFTDLYTNELCYCHYSFMINSDRSGGNCNIFNDLFDRLCISNEKKDVNVKL